MGGYRFAALGGRGRDGDGEGGGAAGVCGCMRRGWHGKVECLCCAYGTARVGRRRGCRDNEAAWSAHAIYACSFAYGLVCGSLSTPR